MQSLKQFVLMMVILLASASLAFGAMTSAQIKEKLEQGLDVQEVVELALLSGATLADVYAAADMVEGIDIKATKESVTAAAIVIATAEPTVGSDGIEKPPAVTLELTEVVESSVEAGVPFATVMASAASDDVKKSITEAAVAVATAEPATAADGTDVQPVISLTEVVETSVEAGVALTTVMESAGSEEVKNDITEAAVTVAAESDAIDMQDVAVALIATGTDEADVNTALGDAGATPDEVSTVNVEAAAIVAKAPAATQTAAEQTAAAEQAATDDAAAADAEAAANETDNSNSPSS